MHAAAGIYAPGPAGKGRARLSECAARGAYGLDLRFQWPSPRTPAEASLQIEQGVAHAMPFFVTLLLVALAPFCVGLYHLSFEGGALGRQFARNRRGQCEPGRAGREGSGGRTKEETEEC